LGDSEKVHPRYRPITDNRQLMFGIYLPRLAFLFFSIFVCTPSRVLSSSPCLKLTTAIMVQWCLILFVAFFPQQIFLFEFCMNRSTSGLASGFDRAFCTRWRPIGHFNNPPLFALQHVKFAFLTLIVLCVPCQPEDDSFSATTSRFVRQFSNP